LAAGASTGAALAPAANTAPTTADGAPGASTKAPDVATQPQTKAQGAAVSGNVYSYYGYENYFYGGDPLQAMSLVSVTQAQTKGSSGSFTDILKSIVSPVVKAWAKDGRLVTSSASLNADGTARVDPNANPASLLPNGGYNSNGWQFVYASDSRSEVLDFTVTPSQTTVIRMRWAPLNLSPDLVTVDATSAIQKLKAAVADKTFKSVEEQSGKDYFLGFPYTQDNGACCGQQVDVLYQIPDGVQWNVSLQSILGKTVWSVNWYKSYNGGVIEPVMAGGVGVAEPAVAPAGAPTIATAADATTADASGSATAAATATPEPKPTIAPVVMPEPSPSTNYWENDNGQGMVDAQTGAVIRFTRPTRTYYDVPMPGVAESAPMIKASAATSN
ncbi:MAG TPA: hypothetical protein V6D47_07905, partial [Oscillatoriaceae cyanobacterium]